MNLINSYGLGASFIDNAEYDACSRILRRRQLFRYSGTGFQSENELFERELCAWTGAESASTFTSGTSALKAALAAIPVGRGDTVLVSAYTFIASASAVLALGATPIPLDSDDNLGVDLDNLRASIPRAAAVMPVYVPGHSSNIDEVVKIARFYGVPVLEDASQALGVTVKGTAAGLVGDIGAYSFQQGKQITCGEGGALVSRSATLLDKATRYADHGALRDLNNLPSWDVKESDIGENFRLNELSAGILRVQLTKLCTMIGLQRTINARARQLLSDKNFTVVNSHDPAGDSCSCLLVRVNNVAIADSLISSAIVRGVFAHRIWAKLFCDLPPVAHRLPEAYQQPLRARDLAPRMVAIPTPPLNDASADLFLAALEAVLVEHNAIWR